MTSTAQHTPGSTSSSSPNRLVPFAVGGLVVSAALTAVGTFLGPNDTGDATRDDASTWLFTVGIAAVGALLVFGLGVRGADRGNAGLRAVVLGVLAVLTVAVFWSGLPPVVAAGAAACAFVDRDRLGSFGTGSKVGLGLAALALAAATSLAFTG